MRIPQHPEMPPADELEWRDGNDLLRFRVFVSQDGHVCHVVERWDNNTKEWAYMVARTPREAGFFMAGVFRHMMDLASASEDDALFVTFWRLADDWDAYAIGKWGPPEEEEEGR